MNMDFPFEERVEEFRKKLRELADSLNLEIHYGFMLEDNKAKDYWAGLALWDALDLDYKDPVPIMYS